MRQFSFKKSHADLLSTSINISREDVKKLELESSQ